MSGEAQEKKRGHLITLEGIEGVGKSTNLEFIAEHLRRTGKDVVVTREPGGVPVAERIRDLLLSTEAGPISPMTELLLIFAARAAHLEELIRPALHAGRWVLCDRFTDASYAYQGAGRGLPAAAIQVLENLVQDRLRPDLTFLLDAGPEATQLRRERRGVSDRFERQDPAFFARVRQAYLALAQRHPDRFRVVDASRPVSGVQAQISKFLSQYLSKSI